MKVLFATTNPAKIKKYADKLKEKNIEVLTIKDLDVLASNIPKVFGLETDNLAFLKDEAVNPYPILTNASANELGSFVSNIANSSA